jgi:hypothetical protein
MNITNTSNVHNQITEVNMLTSILPEIFTMTQPKPHTYQHKPAHCALESRNGSEVPPRDVEALQLPHDGRASVLNPRSKFTNVNPNHWNSSPALYVPFQIAAVQPENFTFGIGI